jgi:cephalosporin hydroxylase
LPFYRNGKEMDGIKKFQNECKNRIKNYGSDKSLQGYAKRFLIETIEKKYSYNFSWLGRPIIQYPQDIVAIQEIIWQVKPDLIIETGIAHGGSLIFSASMLALLDISTEDRNRRVLGVDIDIRKHNRKEIEKHPMSRYVSMIEGSSVDKGIIEKVYNYAKGFKNIIVCLDSNHTHDHVIQELLAYTPLVTKGSYCVVFDTIVENLPDKLWKDSPWGKRNNPKTAVWEFMKMVDAGKLKDKNGKKMKFNMDKIIENKLLISVAPDGFLKRIK